jgi:hypothetical protein
MDPRLREELRCAILRNLDRKGSRYGLVISHLTLLVRVDGFPEITPAEIEKELDYLADANMADQALKIISPENRAWRISKTGRDFLAERGM